MAKTNMIERDKRRVLAAKKYATQRAKLKEAIRSPKSSPDERTAAQARLPCLHPVRTRLRPVRQVVRSFLQDFLLV